MAENGSLGWERGQPEGQEEDVQGAQSTGGDSVRTLPAQQKGLCCSSPLRLTEHPAHPSTAPGYPTKLLPCHTGSFWDSGCVSVGISGAVQVGGPCEGSLGTPGPFPPCWEHFEGRAAPLPLALGKGSSCLPPGARALGVPAGTAELSTSGHRDNKGRVPSVLGNLSGGAEELPAEPGPARGSGPDLGGQGVSWVSFGRLWGGFRGSAPLLAPGPAHTQGNKTQQWLWLLRDPAQPIPPQAQRAQCVPSTGRGLGGSPGLLTQAVSPQSIAQTPPLLPQTAHEAGMGLSVAFLGISHGEAPAQLLLQHYLPL